MTIRQNRAIGSLAFLRAGLSVLFVSSREKAIRKRRTKSSSSTGKKFYLRMGELNALGNLCSVYLLEADACSEAGAYYAAGIMLGASFEAMMLLFLAADPDDLQRAIDSLPQSKRPKGRLLSWDLNDFIIMARHLNWLPCRRTLKERPKIGDRVERLREFRNLVHIGKHLREYPRLLLGPPQIRNARKIFEEAIQTIDSFFNPKVVTNRSKNPRRQPAKRAGSDSQIV